MSLPFLLWASGAFLCAVVLLSASIFDLRNREIPDKVWLIPAPISALLTAVRLLLKPELAISVAISICLSALIGIAIYFSGLMGGADAKAIVFISISVPTYEQAPILALHPFVPLATFSNALLATIAVPFLMLARNLAWKIKTGRRLFEGLEASRLSKMLAPLVGYKVRAEELGEARFLFPMEDVVDEGGAVKRRLVLTVRVGQEEELSERVLEAVRKGLISDYVWVSPGLPLLIFMALGYLLALALGDLVFYTIFAILSTLL
ncbi:MAG TPA: hypothetical protein ENF34_03830 [Candidatus Bathyarchaeota archaeon]|nr:hypothetical protein [Candidatus Bathyarchaeota archaeon]